MDKLLYCHRDDTLYDIEFGIDHIHVKCDDTDADADDCRYSIDVFDGVSADPVRGLPNSIPHCNGSINPCVRIHICAF